MVKDHPRALRWLGPAQSQPGLLLVQFVSRPDPSCQTVTTSSDPGHTHSSATVPGHRQMLREPGSGWETGPVDRPSEVCACTSVHQLCDCPCRSLNCGVSTEGGTGRNEKRSEKGECGVVGRDSSPFSTSCRHLAWPEGPRNSREESGAFPAPKLQMGNRGKRGGACVRHCRFW